ncbi:MAG: twin-arginine translocase subunit TatC [Pirellula sp.]|jgi:sec-independent protein translocase protein TatC|nr:twin-arginine translocase subunit TatC [Pirellula sp.]
MLKSVNALKKSDDLFEKSSMSFGEHLDELRKSLIKASICLLVGMVVGVPSANFVVDYLQTPLRAALETFYEEKSMAEMAKSSGEAVSPELEKWIVDNKKQSEIVFLDVGRLKALNETEKLESDEPSQNESDLQPVNAPEKSDLDTKLKAEIERQLDRFKRFSNPDSTGLPNPSNLIAVRIFRGIQAQSEALSLQEPIFIWFKAALMVAAIIASPGIFYFIWEFVSSGLYPHERRYVYFFLPSSVGLFLIGAAFAFFVVFQLVIGFLLTFNSYMGVGMTPRLNDYMSFALMLPLGFGISFQLPLVMLIVERLGIASIKLYLEQWRIAVFIIFLISMILTPADAYSMVLMAVPLTFLYFLGILLCKYLPRSAMQRGRAVDPR